MAQPSMETMLKVKKKVLESLYGLTEAVMRATSLRALCVEKVFQFVSDTIVLGKYVWNDGRAYEGEWKDNKMEGKGIFKLAGGKVYEGEFVSDKRQGFGIMTW